MSHDEIKSHLESRHAEELADEKTYHKLADDLHEHHPEYSKIFSDMAHEESTHAEMIHHMLSKL